MGELIRRVAILLGLALLLCGCDPNWHMRQEYACYVWPRECWV